jgi:hypothetical protein
LLPNKLFAFLCFSLRHSLRYSAWAGLDLDFKAADEDFKDQNKKERRKRRQLKDRHKQVQVQPPPQEYGLHLVREVTENIEKESEREVQGAAGRDGRRL